MRRTMVLLSFACLWSAAAWAHCDRIDGPVATAAREAMRTAQPNKVLAWVGAEQDKELREAYDFAMELRSQGEHAGQLAERYLVETAIRLHREAEGLPFDGVKPASMSLPRAITAADEALAKGQADEVVEVLSREMEAKVQQLFAATRSRQANRDESLAAAREWVDAYVRYLGFVDGLHEAIEAGPEHGVGHGH